MPGPRTYRRLAILPLALCLMLASTQIALAVFSEAVTGGPLTVASATLSAPTKAAASQTNCRNNKTPEIDVTWSASTSSYLTSYSVERATSSSGPYTSIATPTSSDTSYTDNGALAYSTTYYYRVSAVYKSWTAVSPSTSVKTLSKSCA